MSTDEYHVRQMANQARNEQNQSLADQVALRRRVSEIRAQLEKAMALLDDDSDAEVKAELQRAIDKLTSIAK